MPHCSEFCLPIAWRSAHPANLVLGAGCPHTRHMLQTLLPPILILLGFYLWQSALKAREQARAISHALCAQARVQLLDQTVALQRLGIARGADGWLHLRRRYRFELSIDGLDRHQGTLELLDGMLLSHSMPISDHAPAGLASNVIDLSSRALISTTRH